MWVESLLAASPVANAALRRLQGVHETPSPEQGSLRNLPRRGLAAPQLLQTNQLLDQRHLALRRFLDLQAEGRRLPGPGYPKAALEKLASVCNRDSTARETSSRPRRPG